MKAEIQVLKEMKAYTRPQVVDLSKLISDTANPDVDHLQYFHGFHLMPGWASEGEDVTLRFIHMTPYKPYWYVYAADLFINNIGFGQRPGIVHSDPTDIPSGYVHFIAPGPPENPLYGQTYTLMMRTVEA